MFHVRLHGDVVVNRCMMGVWKAFCMMMCDVVFVCRFIQECRHILLT